MHPVLVLFFLAFALSFSLSLLFFYKFRNGNSRKLRLAEQLVNKDVTDPSLVSCSLSKLADDTELQKETEPTHLPRSSLLGFQEVDGRELGEASTGDGDGRGREKVRKKKKKSKKKKADSRDGLAEGEGECDGDDDAEGGEQLVPGDINAAQGCDNLVKAQSELGCLYPVPLNGSAIQRKIKQRYEDLFKCNETNELIIAQVEEFFNFLTEANKELQAKSEALKRKFSVAKALLFRGDKTSIERKRQQIRKLESEQKRVDEDTLVCSWMHEHLKLSPAYTKMVEVRNSMEQAKPVEGEVDDDGLDISFEELLAQEKKDASFWQNIPKSRQLSSQQQP